MQFRSILNLSVLLPVFLLSCVKETITEKVINPERVADQKIDNSMKTNSANNTLILSKEGLNKAFLLMPSYNMTGKAPMPAYIKPLIISFEKAGNKIALYNLTDEQLYNTLDSNRLLQTFSIVSETEDKITIDLDKGFTSLNSKETISIIEKVSFLDLQEKMQSGEETSIEVKDSVVKNVFQKNNSVFIQQNMRLKKESLKERSENPFKYDSKKIQYLETTEVTEIHTFELKPYAVNTQFKPKNHDKEQQIGYFLNFKIQSQIDEVVPLITAWDISDNSEPIIVRFSDSTPKDLQPTLTEGVTYWNRVIGKNIFQVGDSFKKDEVQPERTLFVYWLPWDSAGFAMAGFQPDPLTGEILKAHVIFTSSWLNAAKGLQTAKNVEFKKPSHYHCMLEQNLLGQAHISNASKATLDILRMVMAHEVGHALGIRHNFVGSSTSPHSDLELQQALDLYGTDKESSLPLSTTVMDYTLMKETAANGSYIKKGIFKYDQAAIDWAYLNKPISISKYEYCSDEHIMTANGYEKSVYGCERFDQYKNIYKFALQQTTDNIKNQVSNSFTSLLENIKYARNSYYQKDFDVDSAINGINYSYFGYNQFEDIAYNNISKKYVSVKNIIDSFMSLMGYGGLYEDYTILETANKHVAEIGGLPGILNTIIDLQRKSDHSFYKNQVDIFFKNLDSNAYQNYLTADELTKVKEKMLQAAIEADKKFMLNALQLLPIQKKSSTYDEMTKQSKEEVLQINTGFTKGYALEILKIYYEAYKAQFNEKSRKITVNGIEIDYTTAENTYGSSSYDFIVNTFASASITSLTAADSSLTKQVLEEKENFKLLTVKNTLEILKAFGVTPPNPMNSTHLDAATNALDWSKVSGLSKYDLQNELRELKKWEELK